MTSQKKVVYRASECYIEKRITASVAKWLRQWIVVPPFEGSIPFARPYKVNKIAHRLSTLRSNRLFEGLVSHRLISQGQAFH